MNESKEIDNESDPIKASSFKALNISPIFKGHGDVSFSSSNAKITSCVGIHIKGSFSKEEYEKHDARFREITMPCGASVKPPVNGWEYGKDIPCFCDNRTHWVMKWELKK